MLLSLLLNVYVVLHLFGAWYLGKSRKTSERKNLPKSGNPDLPKFSLCVAFRNEEKALPRLLESLARLDYPTDSLEVLLVDDASEDKSADLVGAFPLPFPKVRLHAEGQGKKPALEQAIAQAKHPWILITDADCTLSPTWTKAYAQSILQMPEAVFHFGPVEIEDSQSFIGQFERYDLMALSATGLVAGQWGFPLLCNGANLAFSKAAFQAVGGYRDHIGRASGDDMYLYHALHKHSRGNTQPILDNRALVSTAAVEDRSTFWNQRLRWANKWSSYPNKGVSIYALFIFLANLFTLFAQLSLLFKGPSLSNVSMLTLRILADGLFLWQAAKLGKGPFRFTSFFLAELFYPAYAVYFGLAANIKKQYKWKGRKTH